nr:MAG: hypothetical protein [Microvirus sp.]
MVVRIHNIGKWNVCQPGKVLELAGTHKRKIRLEVNCVAPTRVDVIEGEKGTFLAVVQGYEVIEFVAGAQAHVAFTSDDEVWYFTNDGDEIAAERPEVVSFTKIASRRARNPELELMMFKQQQNINRRLDALAAENAAMRAVMEAAVPHDAETGEVIENDENGGAAAGGPAGEVGGGGAGEPVEPAGAGQGGGGKPATVVPA